MLEALNNRRPYEGLTERTEAWSEVVRDMGNVGVVALIYGHCSPAGSAYARAFPSMIAGYTLKVNVYVREQCD